MKTGETTSSVYARNRWMPVRCAQKRITHTRKLSRITCNTTLAPPSATTMPLQINVPRFFLMNSTPCFS